MMKYKHITITLFVILISFQGVSQSDFRLWSGYRVQVRITKQWRLSAGQLYLFGSDPIQLSSLQNQVRLTYRKNGRINVGLGAQKSLDPLDPGKESRNRISARINIVGKLGSVRITNHFRTEWHFPERSKYEYRLRYAFRVYNKAWKLPMGARPFLTNEFHYYLSGKPLWYRDESGEKVVKQSPDGLHSHRATLGIRFRPLKRTNVTISYMRQTEFNIGHKYRRINVVDPRNGRVRRSFNNFSVLALTASYWLKI